MCVASWGQECAPGTPIASSPCTLSTIATCATRPLAAPPSAPPAATPRPECPSDDRSRNCGSAPSCAAGGSEELGPRLPSQRCSPSQHPSSSAGRCLFAHDLADNSRSFAGQHAWVCEANAQTCHRACARMPRPTNSSLAGGSSERLPVHEPPAKRRAGGCAAAGPYEYAPRPRSAQCSPAGGGGRRLYARAREQSRRNEIRRALRLVYLIWHKMTALMTAAACLLRVI